MAPRTAEQVRPAIKGWGNRGYLRGYPHRSATRAKRWCRLSGRHLSASAQAGVSQRADECPQGLVRKAVAGIDVFLVKRIDQRDLARFLARKRQETLTRVQRCKQLYFVTGQNQSKLGSNRPFWRFNVQ
jgi:hypothetical protein